MEFGQRIDAIKSELLSSFGTVDVEGSLQNQFDSMDLDPEDEDTLRHIGLGTKNSGKRRLRHIIFVEDEEAGKLTCEPLFVI